MSINLNPDLPQPNSYVRAIGYGRTSINSSLDTKPTLREVDMPTASNENCEQSWGTVNVSVSSAFQICAGDRDGNCSPCSGDSGGPLLQYTADGSPVVLAVTSFTTNTCGSPGRPSGFVRTSRFIRWLRAKTVGADFRGDSRQVFIRKDETEEVVVSSGKLSTGGLLGIIAGVVALILIFAVVVFVIRRKRKKAKAPPAPPGIYLPPTPAPGTVYSSATPTPFMASSPTLAVGPQVVVADVPG